MSNIDSAFILDPNDVDSYIACEYLSYYLEGLLSVVVMNKKPSKKNKHLLDNLITLFQKQRILGISNVQFLNELPVRTDLVVCCDSTMRVVADAVHKFKFIRTLVTSGGYSAITDGNKPKKNVAKIYYSPIFNRDFNATIKMLMTDDSEINNIYLVGENILKDKANTESGKLWAEDELAQYLFKKYNRPNLKIRNHVSHLITSKLALSMPGQYGQLDPVLKLIKGNPAYVERNKNWYTFQGYTRFRECIIASDIY